MGSLVGERPPSQIIPESLPSMEHSSSYAIHAVMDETESGSRLGVDLAFTGEAYGLYDASAYGGIRFWGMAPGGVEIVVGIGTASDTWVGYGGVLSEVEDSSSQHLDTISLGPSWRQYELSLSSVEELDQVVNIQFIGELAPPGFWIDDLEFTGMPCPVAR